MYKIDKQIQNQALSLLADMGIKSKKDGVIYLASAIALRVLFQYTSFPEIYATIATEYDTTDEVVETEMKNVYKRIKPNDTYRNIMATKSKVMFTEFVNEVAIEICMNNKLKFAENRKGRFNMVKKLKLRESNSNTDIPVLGKLKYTSLVPKDIINDITNYYKQCQKVFNFIQQHEEILEYTDAKLHDVFYEFDDVDDFFLQIEWEEFENYCNEHNIEIEYVGRTSSFYLNDENNKYTKTIRDFSSSNHYGDIYYDIQSIADTIINVETGYDDASIFESDEAFNKFLETTLKWNYDDFEDTGKHDYDPDNTDSLSYAIAEICKEEETLMTIRDLPNIASKVIRELQKVVEAYQYLDDFKDHQVEIYQDWVDNNLEY